MPGRRVKTVKVDKEIFEATLRKMIDTKPLPLSKVHKAKKKPRR